SSATDAPPPDPRRYPSSSQSRSRFASLCWWQNRITPAYRTQAISNFLRTLLRKLRASYGQHLHVAALQEAEGRAGLRDGLEVAREARDTRRGDPRCPDRLLLRALAPTGPISTLR